MIEIQFHQFGFKVLVDSFVEVRLDLLTSAFFAARSDCNLIATTCVPAMGRAIDSARVLSLSVGAFPVKVTTLLRGPD
jgi:hypothetical protein